MQEYRKRSGGALARRQMQIMRQPTQQIQDYLPSHLTEVLPERAYYESAVNALYSARVAQDRDKLEQITKEILGRIAVRNMAVQMDVANQLDEFIQMQPTDELVEMAEEIAAEELQLLRMRIQDESNHTAQDISRMTQDPLTRKPRSYLLEERNRQKLTWGQRIAGYL